MFSLLICRGSLYTVDVSFTGEKYMFIANIFLQSVAGLLSLLMVSFVEQKFLIFKNYLFIYLLWLRRVLIAARGVFIVACGVFSCSMWTF